MDVLCQNSTAPTDDLVYATTLYLDANAHFNANVTYMVTLGFELYDLDLKYTGYDEDRSVIKVQSKLVINKELIVALGVLEGYISVIFDRGHSVAELLVGTPLCWLNLDQILLLPNYQESYLWGGVTPAYDPDRCPDGLPFGSWTLE